MDRTINTLVAMQSVGNHLNAGQKTVTDVLYRKTLFCDIMQHKNVVGTIVLLYALKLQQRGVE